MFVRKAEQACISYSQSTKTTNNLKQKRFNRSDTLKLT